MARIMAFDFGTKRLGIAVTDPMQLIANGLTTIHPKDIVDFLNKYLQTEQVETFVVGEPKQNDGSNSETERYIVGFMNVLKKNFPQIPIVRMDERFTSVMAQRVILQSGLKKSDRQNKALTDTISATIILQGYMQMKGY